VQERTLEDDLGMVPASSYGTKVGGPTGSCKLGARGGSAQPEAARSHLETARFGKQYLLSLTSEATTTRATREVCCFASGIEEV
jgi:hypothetical protein